MSGKKYKLERRIVRQSNLSEKPRRKIGVVAALVGATLLAVSGALYFTRDKNSNSLNFQNSQTIRVEKINQNILDRYVDKMERFGNDESKRTLYVILQTHMDDGWDVSFIGDVAKNLIHKNVKKSSLESQVSIYRIVESLSKDSLARMVADEGKSSKYAEDITDPGSMRRQVNSRGSFDLALDALSKSDDILRGYLNTYEVGGGANLAGLNYEELFLVGWEDAELHKKTMDLSRDTAYKGTILEYYDRNIDMSVLDNPDVRNIQKMNQEQADRLKQDVQKLRDNKGEADKLRKEYNGAEKLFEELNIQRSRVSIGNTFKSCDELYSAGKIPNKNAMLVIGAAHKKDYKDIAEQAKQGKTDYNLVIITPKGTDALKE